MSLSKRRKLFLGIKLYFRVRKARKVERALKKELLDIQKLRNTEKQIYDTNLMNIRRSYEEKLYEERDYNRKMQKEWADRFLQLNKLAPMMILPDEDLRVPIDLRESTTQEDSISLRPEEDMLLLDRKDQFWEDGQALGRSEAEILAEWEILRPQIIKDVRDAMSLSDKPY